MIAYFDTINFVMAVISIALILAGSILVVDLKTSGEFAALIKRYGLIVAFLVTFGAMIGSFVYSDVYGFVPCSLCWFQRIFLFSQVFILGTALYFKESGSPRYGIVLSTGGLIVGIYQHYLQMGGTAFVKCPVSGAGSDCAQRFFFEFGFVTFPLMSAFVFLFLIAVYTYTMKVNKV